MEFFVKTNRAQVLQRGDIIEVDFEYDDENYFDSAEETDLFTMFFQTVGDKNYITKFVFDRSNLDAGDYLWDAYDGLEIFDEDTGEHLTLMEFAQTLLDLIEESYPGYEV